MRIAKYFFFLLISSSILSACQDDDAQLGAIVAPSDLQIITDIVGQDAANPAGDGSGLVNVTAAADGAISYKFVFNGNEVNSVSGSTSLLFTNVGLNTYDVTVVAYGAGGVSTSTTFSIEVLVTYTPPQDLLNKLVGTGSKTWRIKAEKAKHFGLGPAGGTTPAEWYGAGPFEKSAVGMYDDRYIFDADGTFTHIVDNTNDDPNQDPSGTVFGRDGLISEIGSGGTVDGADILNLPYQDYAGTWQVIGPGGVETIVLSGTSFIGYYTGGNHQYQIFDRSVANEIMIKTTDGNGEFDWWFILTDTEEIDAGEPEYDELVWSEEFEGTSLDPRSWQFDIGTGPDMDGWGNNEEQYYTDRPENATVSNGTLKINAVKENYDGSSYTSARIKSDDLFEFTYGRVEIKAKLPGGAGTWPALWMLGENYENVGWPDCGEIDIMEYVGSNPDNVFATMHWKDNSGGNGPSASTTVTNAETEFHIYECYWSPTVVRFYVDGNEFHSVNIDDSMPFNEDFYLVFNVAMGGTLGGSIDPNFTSATMEIDYLKVYQ